MGILGDIFTQIPNFKSELVEALGLVGMKPNLLFGDFRSGNLPNDTREAYFHWMHVECRNARRPVWLGRLRTMALVDTEFFFEVFRHGEGSVMTDRAMFVGGVSSPAARHSFMVGDSPVHVPVLLDLPKKMSHHLRPEMTIEPGTYLTGQRFIQHGQIVTERLSAGRYTVQINRGPGEHVEGVWAHEFQVHSTANDRTQLAPIEGHQIEARDSTITVRFEEDGAHGSVTCALAINPFVMGFGVKAMLGARDQVNGGLIVLLRNVIVANRLDRPVSLHPVLMVKFKKHRAEQRVHRLTETSYLTGLLSPIPLPIHNLDLGAPIDVVAHSSTSMGYLAFVLDAASTEALGDQPWCEIRSLILELRDGIWDMEPLYFDVPFYGYKRQRPAADGQAAVDSDA